MKQFTFVWVKFGVYWAFIEDNTKGQNDLFYDFLIFWKSKQASVAQEIKHVGFGLSMVFFFPS